MIWFPHSNVHLDKRIVLVELDNLAKPLQKIHVSIQITVPLKF